MKDTIRTNAIHLKVGDYLRIESDPEDKYKITKIWNKDGVQTLIAASEKDPKIGILNQFGGKSYFNKIITNE